MDDRPRRYYEGLGGTLAGPRAGLGYDERTAAQADE